MERIAGIDEVGRGAIAGPIVAAGVVVRYGRQLPEGVADSKVVTDRARRRLVPLILDVADVWYGIVSNSHIDRLGIQVANVMCVDHVVRQLPSETTILADHIGGFRRYTTSHRSPIFIVHGERKHKEIAAASIVAKVVRDNLMREYARKYPEYLFSQHMGYGTVAHRKAVRKHGPSPIHRVSFRFK